MHVVATAGHVDHGKSTLVRALTGQEPDRLVEEQRRGLTIELGYCWTTLQPVGDVAFVDVPGHERFLTTMMSGVASVPAVMLVVAADEPWMPQAAEHLAILDALGDVHGLLVVTRADLADPAPALMRARAEVDRTSLAGAPSVVVSGRTGEGMDELRNALVSVLMGLPAPQPAAPVRLWIDRCFVVRGAGTVVTGTLPQGSITTGMELSIHGASVRVRGIETLGIARDHVSGPARVALRLGGQLPEIHRGDALIDPGHFRYTARADVSLAGAGKPPKRPVLHIGAGHIGTRARTIGAGLARLELERQLPLRYADRAILRDPGSRRVWGVTVLDPIAPDRPLNLEAHDGTPESELRLRGLVRRSILAAAGLPLEPIPRGTLVVGDWLVAEHLVDDLRSRLVGLARRPIAPAEAANILGLPDPAIASALVASPLCVQNGRITCSAQVPSHLAAAAAVLHDELADFAIPTSERLDELGLDNAALGSLHRAGLLLRLEDRVVLLPGADSRAAEVLKALPAPFTASEARQALSTSRRATIALLVHLDRAGCTVRYPDNRRRIAGPVPPAQARSL